MAFNDSSDERYNIERCAMRKHQQTTHLKAIEGAVVLDYEILALAHREEVAVLTQQVGHVDGFRCSPIREITREKHVHSFGPVHTCSAQLERKVWQLKNRSTDSANRINFIDSFNVQIDTSPESSMQSRSMSHSIMS
jgi:hypothetical protein